MAKKQLKPNIIFLLIDSARADHFSCYGYGKKTTPFIDSLASDGIQFENAISPSGSTKPVMYSIFTGMHLSKVGNASTLNPNYRSMPEILKSAGYYTVGISHNPWVSSVTALDRGFDEFWFWDRANVLRLAGLKATVGKALARKLFNSDLCIENVLAKKFIRQNKKRPFFLYLHYGDVHHPYDPPEAILKPFLDADLSLQDVRRTNKDAHHFLKKDPGAIPDRTIRILQNLYDGVLAYEDRQIQNLVEFIAAKKLLNDTLIIITADHGDNIGEKGLFSHKFILNEPLIHVPLILHLPGYFSGGVKSEKLVQTTDILPTLLQMINCDDSEIWPELQGYSLANFCQEDREFAISERIFSAMSKSAKIYVKRQFPLADLASFRHHIVALRARTQKYIWSSLGYHELYDLAADPGETENLITRRSDLARVYEDKLATWRRSFPAFETMSDDKLDGFDANMIKQLKSLGYVD